MPSNRRFRLRLKLCGFAILGPGKADLLESLKETGSISAAARRDKLSYRKAWMMIDELNRALKEPVVETAFGGARGGGARLTPMGEAVLTAFREMERKATEAAAEEIAFLDSILGPEAREDAIPTRRFDETEESDEES